MNNVSDIYTLWLKPWHLPPDKPISVTIQKAEVRIIHPRPTEEKKAIILTFVGKNHKLILNDGNANKMADIGGEDWAGWQGLVVQLQRTKFTKDKETIHILPADTKSPSITLRSGPEGKSAASQPIVAAPEPLSKPGNGNGHAEEPAAKPYRFPSGAAENFWKEVQKATDNFYQDPPHLLKVIDNWFNFGSEDLWKEKLSTAVDHARIKRQAAAPVEVEDQSIEAERVVHERE